ncbi:hypothetical protein TWF281_004786 [Arthrobotrys megalospora]
MADQLQTAAATDVIKPTASNDENPVGDDLNNDTPSGGDQNVPVITGENIKNTESSDLPPETPAQTAKEPGKAIKKRGRPSKSSNDQEAGVKRKRSKPSSNESAPRPTAKDENAEADTPPENRKRGRGRKAGVPVGSWTTEQDAYLRQLYQQTTVIRDVHERFEEKFNSGKSPNSLQLRWGKLKRDSLVLTPKEEEILKRAVHTVENNKAAAVLEMYMKEGEESVTKLTQTFVAMRLKKWGGVPTNSQKTEDAEQEVDSGKEA